MPVQVQFSKCDKPEVETSIRERTVQVFQNVPEEWVVSIVANEDNSIWKMNVSGPGSFNYELRLRGAAGEQNPDFVVTAIKQAIMGELSG